MFQMKERTGTGSILNVGHVAFLGRTAPFLKTEISDFGYPISEAQYETQIATLAL
jgi:hypothetical protein